MVIPPHKTAVLSGAGDTQRDHDIEVIAQHGRLAWQRITGYNLRNYAELAVQRYKRIFGNTMKARAAAAENRGMDQCVCTEPNDQSRYAGVRESPKSSEHRGALLKFSASFEFGVGGFGGSRAGVSPAQRTLEARSLSKMIYG